MRFAYSLVAVIVFGVLLTFASTANAQVFSSDEASGVPCFDVRLSGHSVTGGCPIYLVSEGETLLVAGTGSGPIPISDCEEYFEAHIDGRSEGYIDVATMTAHASGTFCTRTPCDEANGVDKPWRIHGNEGPPGTMSIEFCWRNVLTPQGSMGTTCIVNIPWTQVAHPHVQSFNGESGLPCVNHPPGALTVYGHWHTLPDSDHPPIEWSHGP